MRLRRSSRRSPAAESPATAPTVALFGAGMIAMAHGAAARLASMPVVAVASRSTERAETRARELDAVAVHYDDLRSGSVTADIVVVATPPNCHAADAIDLLDHGYAVLLEKPLCRTLAEADALVAAAARNGNRLLYGENLAYAPVIQQLVTRSARIGPLTAIEVRSLQGLPTWGGFTTDDWGGGALFDLGVHPLAVALLCANAAGEGMPSSVTATLRGGTGHGSDEWAEVHLHYAGGLVARVEASWQAGPAPIWDAQVSGASDVVRAEVMPEPALEHNGEPVPLPATTTAIAPLEQFGYLAQLRALAADLAAGDEPVMSATFGRLVLDVVCAAYTSARRGGGPAELPFTGPRDLTPLELWRRG